MFQSITVITKRSGCFFSPLTWLSESLIISAVKGHTQLRLGSAHDIRLTVAANSRSFQGNVSKRPSLSERSLLFFSQNRPDFTALLSASSLEPFKRLIHMCLGCVFSPGMVFKYLFRRMALDMALLLIELIRGPG